MPMAPRSSRTGRAYTRAHARVRALETQNPLRQVILRVLFSMDGYPFEPGNELRILHKIRQIGPHEID